jgi:hypothetical protein
MHTSIKPSKELVTNLVSMKSVGKEDYNINIKSLRSVVVADVEEVAKIKYYTGRETELEFSRWAQTQLFNKGRIPVQFYDRCSLQLQSQIFNEHIPGKEATLLMRRTPSNRNTSSDTKYLIRAVLTDSYGIIDDSQVFPAVLDTLAEQLIEVYRKFEFDEHITRLFVDFPDCSAVYQGAEHIAGLVISNSETGHSSVWIEPSVNIPNCHFVNRSVLRSQGVDCRVVHRGEISDKRIKDMVLKAKEIAQVGVVQIAEAWNEMLPIARVLSFTKQMEAMPDRIRDILDENWSHQEEISKAAAAQQIILAVKDLPLFQRLQVEQAAGSFIGLFHNYRARMVQIMEEINS